MDLKEETSMDLKEETCTDSKKTSMDLKEETSMDSKEETSTDSKKTSIDSEEEIVVMCPWVEAEVELREGKFHLIKKIHGYPGKKKCEAPANMFKELAQVKGIKYVFCIVCKGKGHEECYKNSPIKHPLHPKHPLMFVRCDAYAKRDAKRVTTYNMRRRRKCICCEDPLDHLFYWCPSCDFGINLVCVEKQTLITVDHPKRHEHTLTLFPRQVTTMCNVCALDDSRSPIYICPACDFVVHKRCIDLPWSIRISRHPQHRLSFRSSFVVGNLSCNICRRKINNDYGGYSCNKEGCSYFAHSRCATGKNVWDGQELEGVLEKVEEEAEPFERLGNGFIKHFSHDHRLKLNEVGSGDYVEYKSCEACVMPIYDGNFYSCVDCSFILHEACANISHRIYHAIHPHPLVLRTGSPSFYYCSACHAVRSGFFYECSHQMKGFDPMNFSSQLDRSDRSIDEGCRFMLDIRCAMIHEPLMHNSHVHPLFLTSAPEEYRSCSICKNSGGVGYSTHETFNCIESECDFSLCYTCGFLPQKVRYKHDDHILTLFYGEEETSETKHWCELCEMEIKPGKRFYTCDDYCCVTLHIECLLGKDMAVKIGSNYSNGFQILPNNGMTRPVCSRCHKRCDQKVVFQRNGLKYCCFACAEPGHILSKLYWAYRNKRS